MIQRPIFPGYVFTHLDLRDRNHLFSVPGVVRMLSFNGAAAPIDDEEIEAVQLCLERGANPQPHPFLEVGERVKVISGALAGLEGVVARHRNQLRIVVSIALINQAVAVEIDADMIERTETSSTLRPLLA